MQNFFFCEKFGRQFTLMVFLFRRNNILAENRFLNPPPPISLIIVFYGFRCFFTAIILPRKTTGFFFQRVDYPTLYDKT